ncbi:nitrous oxide reductase family maturation protein NosD [Streptomyces sp. NPDC087659]|uniref:right-handed parallel beta-helix repeat-containing protein n=1 Tax=unclassified Streptomyces TaxID=2593676 RepID=UPI0033DB3F8A
MTKRQFMYLGCVALMVTSGLGVAAPAGARTTYDVVPGESIQLAVDRARPGDTIDIAPGVYRESVLIRKSDLTLRGAGDRTVLLPSTAKATHVCGLGGNGICVIGTDAKPATNVRIHSLTVSQFKKNGIWASRTNKLSVREVTAAANGNWGIAQERSLRSEIRGNAARDNAESGIFVSNTIDTEAGAINTRRTVVMDNLLAGNRIGITVRRLRNLYVNNNVVTGNCAGMFVVGDEGVPRTGDLTVRGNRVHHNNKSCAKTARLPRIQGAGIVLTGVEGATVASNAVWSNVGTSPFSGGIVLFKSIVGAPNSGNVIKSNMLVGNRPADLANRDTGTGNTFSGNYCRLSEKAGKCA